MVVAFAVAIMIPKGLTSVFRITCYTEQSFETAHFLMMEINPKAYGYYSEDDVQFSQSFETKTERDHADIQVFWQRLHKYGI